MWLHIKNFIGKFPFLLPLIVFLMVGVSHQGHLGKGPRGVHVWRQCNTLAVAKNFADEEMNILHPRVDNRKNTNGITGAAFPAYEYVLALLYRALGFSESMHRWLQLCITGTLLFGGFFLGMALFNNHWLPSLIISWVLAWSPDLYYHGINALPDVMALSSAIWGLYFYVRYKADNNQYFLIYAALCIALAGLVKLQYLMFGGVIVIDSWIDRSHRKLFPTMLAIGISAIPPAAWYTYAIWLREMSGLKDFGLFLNPVESVSEGLSILKDNLFSDFPELLIGYALFPLVIIGLIFTLINASNSLKIKLVLITLGLFIFHFLELDQMKFHGYYMMPYILLAAILSGFCVLHMIKSEKKYRKWLPALLILALMQPFITKARIDFRYVSDKHTQMPLELVNDLELNELRDLIKQSHKVLVGPDASGCIFFYQLQCKGWCIQNESMNISEIQNVLRGNRITHIVIHHPNETLANALSLRFASQVIGNFEIWLAEPDL